MKLTNAVKCTLPAVILGLVALGLTPTSAFAVTATANVAVTATVQANCTITTGSMAFGTYTGATAPARQPPLPLPAPTPRRTLSA